MAILFALIGYYILSPGTITPTHIQAPPLAGENEIRNITVKPDEYNNYMVEVDYRYRGGTASAALRVYALETGQTNRENPIGGQKLLKRGVHKEKVHLSRRMKHLVAHTTRYVRVEMIDWRNKEVILSKVIEHPIDWARTGYIPSPARGDSSIETLYKDAVAEIDYGSKASLNNAKSKLEAILTRDDTFVPAYPELARYYMKTNWGPEGRRQAERSLDIGLNIDPGHANSLVLIGYVYAHQGRFKEAEEALSKAAKIGTENLWLWANWGELLLMQGSVEKAIEMYNKAIEPERPYTTYDRAQRDAYRHLIKIYEFENNYALADKLHLKRTGEYTTEACFPYYYAEFRQLHFDSVDTVLKYAKSALEKECQYGDKVRMVIGAAYYTKWARSRGQAKAQAYLGQAQLFFPEGPNLIYWLGKSEYTLEAIQALLDDGTSIDVKDNNGMTGLAYSIKEDDIEAASRIVAMGGDTNSVIGNNDVPLLALAILSENTAAVKLLVENGADARAHIYDGVTLIELAEGMGYKEIEDLLKSAKGKRI